LKKGSKSRKQQRMCFLLFFDRRAGGVYGMQSPCMMLLDKCAEKEVSSTVFQLPEKGENNYE